MLFLPELLPPLGVGPCDGAGELVAVVSCRSFGAARLGVLVVCVRRRVCVSRARSARWRRRLRQEILSLSSFPASVARAPVSPRSWRGSLYRSWSALAALWSGRGDLLQDDGVFATGLVAGRWWIRRGSAALATFGGGSRTRGVPGMSPAGDPQRRRSFGTTFEVSKVRWHNDALPVLGVGALRPFLRRRLGDGGDQLRSKMRFSRGDPRNQFVFFLSSGSFLLLCVDTCPFCVVLVSSACVRVCSF